MVALCACFVFLDREALSCATEEVPAWWVTPSPLSGDRLFSSVLGDANRQISEYKFKLSKAEQDITTLEQSVSTSNDNK